MASIMLLGMRTFVSLSSLCALQSCTAAEDSDRDAAVERDVAAEARTSLEADVGAEHEEGPLADVHPDGAADAGFTADVTDGCPPDSRLDDAPADSGAAPSEGGASSPSTLKLPHVFNQGGPVLTAMDVVPIFFAGDPLRSELDMFNAWFLTSNYWTDLGNEYGVGHGTMQSAVQVTTSAPATISRAQIVEWMASLINQGTVPAPQPNRTYVVYYPPSTTVTSGATQSCLDFFGFHTTTQVQTASFTGEVPFAVIPRCGDPEDQLTITTDTASHEYFETATDPFENSRPAWTLVPAKGSDDEAWLMIGGAELSDLCTNEPYDTIQGVRLQHAWSNTAAASGLNPCQPNDATYPYFTVVTDQNVYRGTPGSTLTIHGRGWSNRTTPAWQIGVNTTWVPASDFDGQAQLDKTTISSGEDVAISVRLPDVPADAGSRRYQFTIDSLDAKNLNFYHPWPVMVVVQ